MRQAPHLDPGPCVCLPEVGHQRSRAVSAVLFRATTRVHTGPHRSPGVKIHITRNLVQTPSVNFSRMLRSRGNWFVRGWRMQH
eukprot:6832530-Lingulodinium_polyedra.AAC.1